MSRQRYTTTLVTERRRVFLPIPFDPDTTWGDKTEHHVRGTINDLDVRGAIEPLDSGLGLVLGPAWRRDRHLDSGDTVDVMLEPEGPQRDDLADDVLSAFETNVLADTVTITPEDHTGVEKMNAVGLNENGEETVYTAWGQPL